MVLTSIEGQAMLCGWIAVVEERTASFPKRGLAVGILYQVSNRKEEFTATEAGSCLAFTGGEGSPPKDVEISARP